MKKLPLLLLFFSTIDLAGQAIHSGADSVNLTTHRAFFHQQSNAYRSWLEKTHLNKAFTFYNIEILQEGVVLNLRFAAAEADSISAIWFSAKSTFETNSLLDLEEALFLKMLRLFDLQSSQAFIQIKNSFKPIGEQYHVKIYTIDDQLRVDENFSKGFFDKIDINLNQSEKRTIAHSLDHPDDYTKKQVYELVRLFFAKEYGEQQAESSPIPVIDAFYSLNGKLMINVSGLYRRVLQQEDELLFCSILNRLKWDCESVKREALNFEFDFDTKSKQIYCQLDGKYSNDYLLFHGKVQDMDDDPQFEELLQKYGKNFLKKLKKWIEQQ